MIPTFARFTFICADCGTQHNSPTHDIPTGWALVSMDCSGAPFVRCPDCGASVEQAQHHRMTDFMTNMHPPQPVPPSRLTLDEHTALTFLAEGARAMTWPIANACGLIAGGRCLPQARNMLRRLERWGLIARNKVMGHHTSWSITEAGRKAVQP